MIETFRRAWKPANAYVAVSAVAGRTRGTYFLQDEIAKDL